MHESVGKIANLEKELVDFKASFLNLILKIKNRFYPEAMRKIFLGKKNSKAPVISKKMNIEI